MPNVKLVVQTAEEVLQTFYVPLETL